MRLTFGFLTYLASTFSLASPTHYTQVNVPAELVGKWTMREGSGTSYRDSRTGQISAPNANTYTYTISTNGRFEHAALLSSSLYQCTMQMFGIETGRVELSGERITFVDHTAAIKSTDTCRPEWNYEKAGKLSRVQYGWRLDRDKQGRKLILIKARGKEDAYYRQ